MARRRGIAATLRTARSYLSLSAEWNGTYVWYALDLHGERPRRGLDDALRLFRAGPGDVGRYVQLPSAPQVMGPNEELAAERFAEGAELWMVSEGDTPAFACWIFRGSAPLAGARGHRMDLPADVVLLEDSLASPDFRGRGVAPGAWSGIADACAAAGARLMVTKVREDNAPSCRAVEKAGFVPVATMTRSGPPARPRIAVLFADAPPRETWLAAVQR